jgi:indole-3-glycerol phosphate synthase
MGDILEKILCQRRRDVEALEASKPLEEMRLLAASARPLAAWEKLRRPRDGEVLVFAEIKRASPSKGHIADVDAAAQALEYARGGASVISVLTEPHFFKGSIDDLAATRAALEALGDARPLVLRKDFLFSEYQIVEARAFGADLVLLIVAALDDATLRALLRVARDEGMEALVEVNSAAEMLRAVDAGARLVGVNNRNLRSFDVALDTTAAAVAALPPNRRADIFVAALSGITSRAAVRGFGGAIEGVLVGEALMRARNPSHFIRRLTLKTSPPFVKICGVRDVETAVLVAVCG